MIVDMNALLGRWPFWTLKYEDVEGVLALMDRAGIDKAVVTSMNSVFRVDYETGNREVAEACRLHSDRLIPFVVVNPNMALWKDHLKACVKNGARGIKLHPDYHKYGLLGGETATLMEEARNYGLPVYIQRSLIDQRNLSYFSAYRQFYCVVPETPTEQVASLVTKYPENKIIVGGAGRGGNHAINLVRQVPEAKNFYIETSVIDAGPLECLEQLTGTIGSSRLLFGTRMPLLIPEAAKMVIEKSNLSREDKQRILGENAVDLLSITK